MKRTNDPTCQHCGNTLAQHIPGSFGNPCFPGSATEFQAGSASKRKFRSNRKRKKR